MRFPFVAAATLIFIPPAFGQRADDNALAAAEDAFGMTVGTETIGLYSADEVRGFSAIDAGNARLDGLYFDLQTDLTDHLIDSSAMRVGISSQGYPLPAPTGIVDYKLRRPGEKRLISALVSYGEYDSRIVSIDAQLPVLKDKLSVGLGGSLGSIQPEYGAGLKDQQSAVILRWRPTDRIDVVPFWTRQLLDDDGPRPLIFVAGSYLPEKYLRGNYFGQSWTGTRSTGDTFGVLTEAKLSDAWALKAGVFRSIYASDHSFSELYRDAQPDGVARYEIVADPAQRYASTSGEVRLARSFVTETLQQSLQFAVRNRDQRRRYGGSDSLDLGLVRIGERRPIDRPDFHFGPEARDHVKQTTLGLAYSARWPARAEGSVGVQKVRYRKEVELPFPNETTLGKDDPTLFNAGGTVHVSEALSFYASYSRGLEEGGVAPASAVNKDAAPAIKTQQKDGGLKLALTPQVQVIAGVFDIRKPYYSVDGEGLYRKLADQSHRGVELSVSGQVSPRANVAVGAVLMRPRVEGELVDSGEIGDKPVGQTSRSVIANAEYRFAAIQGLSVDTNIVSYGSRVASSDNSLEIPSRTVVGIGARHRFTMGRAQATIRLHVGNVFNNYGWRTNASGVFEPNAQRSFYAEFAADF
jgi:iron complex outermembrane receptor protein